MALTFATRYPARLDARDGPRRGAAAVFGLFGAWLLVEGVTELT
jgi:hypothetical protein